MPASTTANTIRILVSTDNHVGYNERDPNRGDDSWKSFHEVMCLARERDVDMVLLAGDLFHENKPSRKSMYQVMRSLRMNCYGEKPCELEMLSDASEIFAGAFNHVNYEDPDINVAIPVFSIHGNHDDPSGEGHLAALDILQMSGLINYYGRTPESDNILIKPVLLQKGNTKLALYGMSNVRDERLFRTFRDGNVKFFQPSAQKEDWFNLLSVHQNHHAYTETGYLPEHFLPSFVDLVIWGHEHECLIDPRTNPEMGFRVMQPGSSVATSLVPGEAVPKHVAILSITGKQMQLENIRLKTVRPFLYRDIALHDDREMRKAAHDRDNRAKVHRFLASAVEKMIEEANAEWLELQQESSEQQDEALQPPLPLIRLRVEYSAPDGGEYHMDNPQRFSNRFVGRVANVNDVVQYHRKRTATTRVAKNQADMPASEVLAQLSIDSVKVEKLVEEFLTAQSLTILPQNTFSDAVGQFVDKDDKHAMTDFIVDALESQFKELAGGDEQDDYAEKMEEIKAHLEEQFQKGQLKRRVRKGSRKPKPAEWDSDLDGHWEDDPASVIYEEAAQVHDVEDDEDTSVASRPTAAKGTGGNRGGKAGAATKSKAPAGSKKAPALSKPAKKKPTPFVDDDDDDEDDDGDIVMIDDADDDDEPLFVQPTAKKSTPAPPKATVPRSTKTPAKTTARVNGSGTQTQLSWGTNTTNGTVGRSTGSRAATKKLREPSEDEISDDDAFEPPPPSARFTRAGRR